MTRRGLWVALVGLAISACKPPPVRSNGPADAGSAVGVDGNGDGGSSADAGIDGGPSPACAALWGNLQQALDQARQGSGSPGAILAVITPDCGRWVGASGTSTDAVAVGPTDVFRAASVTKTFVAASVLELAAEGTLGLDDALEKWEPNLVPNGSHITLRQLLNHTSGIFDYTHDSTFQQAVGANPQTVWAPKDLVGLGTSHPPYFSPGVGWHYSSTNYIVLGMIVEKATGLKVSQVIRSRLLDRLGLESTFFDGEETVQGQFVHGFDASNSDVTNQYSPSVAWSAGAMVASAGDLAEWARALYGGSVLDPGSLQQMLTTVDTGVQGMRYGLGVFALDASLAGTTAWGHLGDTWGYHTQMFYLPDKKSVIVSMVNSDAASSGANDITAAVLPILLQ